MRVGQTRRRDFLEASIVQALEQIGCTVLAVSGKGCPDLLVHSRGRWVLMEVKGPSGKLTPAQKAVLAVAPYPVVRSVSEALALFQVQA